MSDEAATQVLKLMKFPNVSEQTFKVDVTGLDLSKLEHFNFLAFQKLVVHRRRKEMTTHAPENSRTEVPPVAPRAKVFKFGFLALAVLMLVCWFRFYYLPERQQESDAAVAAAAIRAKQAADYAATHHKRLNRNSNCLRELWKHSYCKANATRLAVSQLSVTSRYALKDTLFGSDFTTQTGYTFQEKQIALEKEISSPQRLYNLETQISNLQTEMAVFMCRCTNGYWLQHPNDTRKEWTQCAFSPAQNQKAAQSGRLFSFFYQIFNVSLQFQL